MSTAINMILIFADDDLYNPPPVETFYIIAETGDQIVDEDGLTKLITE